MLRLKKTQKKVKKGAALLAGPRAFRRSPLSLHRAYRARGGAFLSRWLWAGEKGEEEEEEGKRRRRW